MVRAMPTLVFIACALTLGALLPAPETKADSGEVVRETGLRVLGGTRGYATAALWLRAGDAYKRGDLWETESMYQLIRQMQPRNPAVYSYLSWNEGYNILGNFPDKERQLPWLERGLRTIHEGQQALPHDASLRMEEWHYVFNRTRMFPLDVLSLELPAWREREPRWALVVESILATVAKFDANQKREFESFNEKATLPVGLIPLVQSFRALSASDQARLLDSGFDRLSDKEQGELGLQFDLADRQQLRAYLPLSDEVKALLALCNWARLHLMTACARPAIEMQPRALSVDGALLNSYLHAQRNLPPELEEVFTPQYKAGVKAAYKAGAQQARAAYGAEGETEFRLRMKENFGELADWLE